MTTTPTTTAAALTRTVRGRTLPAAGRYEIDASHSSAAFTVRHLGLSKVRGQFTDFAGTIEIADDPARSSVGVTLEAASFSTGSPDRDAHVRSADFLDVDNHPVLTYRSTAVREGGDGWIVEGTLTIRGTSRPVVLDVDFGGAGTDPWGNGRLAFTASTEIDREEFGLTWNQALETGGVLVGKRVKVEIEVQAVAQP